MLPGRRRVHGLAACGGTPCGGAPGSVAAAASTIDRVGWGEHPASVLAGLDQGPCMAVSCAKAPGRSRFRHGGASVRMDTF